MVPSYTTSPLTVFASALADSICTSEMSPFTVSAERSPAIRLAAIRTALLLQVFTAISPPKLFTSRRAPARTGTVVSVCCASARPASVARVVSMLVCPPLGLRARECRRLPQELQFAPHLLGEVQIQV